MGSGAPSPKALSPPFGSRQKPPDERGKKGALMASASVPPPPAQAAGLELATGGGGVGGAPRGSSRLQPRRATDAAPRASAMTTRSILRGPEPEPEPDPDLERGVGLIKRRALCLEWSMRLTSI